jgi:hypothetical protein
MMAVAAFGQAPFTIVRPADGASVRETIHVEVPRSSVPNGGYVGLFVNDNFVKAQIPVAKGNYYDVPVDTKGYADGKTKIELVLFLEFNDEPRIVDRSSVTVIVRNAANIGLPPDGLILRYHFTPGTETTYNVANRVVERSLTKAQLARGRKAVDLPIDAENLRVDYDVVNTYAGGESLLLLQSKPLGGAKNVFLQTISNTSGQWYKPSEFGQAYMRVSSTGYEVAGAVPESFTLEGAAATPPTPSNVWYLEALPNLPVRRVKPGDSWQCRVLFPDLDLGNVHSTKRVMKPIPARGQFIGVEWELGRPCAKIVNTADISGDFPRNVDAAHMQEVETVWYALDRRQVLRMVRYIVVDRPSAAPAATPGTAGPAGPPAGGGAPGPMLGPGGINLDSLPPEVAQQIRARQRRQNNDIMLPTAGQTPTGPGMAAQMRNRMRGGMRGPVGVGAGATPPPMPTFGANGAAQPAPPPDKTDRIVIEETFTLVG